MLERAIENGLTPEADRFLEVRTRLLFGEGEVRDLSKANDPELYGRREAFNRLMWELFELGPAAERMILKKERISREARAARWHRSVGKVPETSLLVLGVREQDEELTVTLVEDFSEAMEGIIDPEDIEVFSRSTDAREDPISILGVNAIWKRLREELETTLSLDRGAPTTFGAGPIVDVYVRAEDKDRNADIDFRSRRTYTLKEVLIKRVKEFCQENEYAQETEGKVYLTIHWGDEQEEIEVEFSRESSV